MLRDNRQEARVPLIPVRLNVVRAAFKSFQILFKHFTLITIILALVLFTIAATRYPGGSQKDSHSIGFNWKNNYLCNLFSPKAVNGENNGSRYWAVPGMLLLCAGIAVFYIRFSKSIPSKSSASIIKYCGVVSVLILFFVVTPLHDPATSISATLALIAIFYTTIYVFKTKFVALKILSVVYMLMLYLTIYIYYSGNLLDMLPTMQKLLFLIEASWMLALTYTTSKEDFAHIKFGKKVQRS